MTEAEKKELGNELEELHREKEELVEQIRELDRLKIEKLTKENEDLEKRVEWLDKEAKKAEREKDNFLRQVKNSRHRKWFNSFKMISLIGIIDLLIIPIVVFLLGLHMQWIFIGMGLVTFFGILLVANYMSGTSPFDTGEIRKALTGAFITVYLTFVPIVTFEGAKITGTSANTVIANFTWIVGIIIIFYFGSRTVEAYVNGKGK
ncbi:hypothetical protein [Methanobacterium aggregans]|uniref:hypothetical protein n=1 Tax=Methanobacterium aggregans TaxID=1615586 RepID=UPI001AE6F0C3|nr:hypothetical protein [Methanobacterium aggregans]MBP2046940.1 hypothetical protein [Methanobacterium aggregans]